MAPAYTGNPDGKRRMRRRQVPVAHATAQLMNARTFAAAQNSTGSDVFPNCTVTWFTMHFRAMSWLGS
jgi:hypothetical protein